VITVAKLTANRHRRPRLACLTRYRWRDPASFAAGSPYQPYGIPSAISAGAVFSQSVDDLVCPERRAAPSVPSKLHKAADAYFVRRGTGKTLIAGYPWFGDWGRDTFIALRGLCLATGRFEDAKDILVEWDGTVSEVCCPIAFLTAGRLPNLTRWTPRFGWQAGRDSGLLAESARSATRASKLYSIQACDPFDPDSGMMCDFVSLI
jgi:Amylo-alpha-1,6-glucosidase